MAGVYKGLRSRYAHLLRSRSLSERFNTMSPSDAAAVKARYAEVVDGGIESRCLTKVGTKGDSVDRFGEHGYPLDGIKVHKMVDIV